MNRQYHFYTLFYHQLGRRHIRTMADGWTVVTADGSLSAHFEHTVAVTPEGPKILTGRRGDRGSKEE